MKKYVLVTGGAGYIGSHTIIDIFSNTDYEVISVDNFSNSFEETYQQITDITNKKLISINENLCDKNNLFEKLHPYKNQILGIIHFAAYKSVPESMEHPLKYYYNNIQSLLNIIEFAKENKIQNFIFSSSCSVYGDIKTSPVTENTPLPLPNSPYAHTKQIGEQILHHLITTANYPLKAYSLRYFNPVGAHLSGKTGELPKYNLTGLVPNIIRTALGKIPELHVYGNDYNTKDGTPVRDYIHVCDIASAHVLALQKLLSITTNHFYDTINLGTGKGFTVLEVIKKFEEITHIKLHYKISERRSGDVEAIFANNDKAYEELNWKPVYSLEDMLKSAWEWGKNKY
ncbi:MAG: UDP-glucose 4-epimerase GalE [Bacteroidia bacterium]|nr:UDP-glucose 4-epimerase GalE [Bacteroidia bacterium]